MLALAELSLEAGLSCAHQPRIPVTNIREVAASGFIKGLSCTWVFSFNEVWGVGFGVLVGCALDS